jgi:6-phosphogluconolactonase (cycloisomerase 2 family)
MVTFDYDAATGHLKPKQTISSLPPGFCSTNYTSEVEISAHADFVYAANKAARHDCLVVNRSRWDAAICRGTAYAGRLSTFFDV